MTRFLTCCLVGLLLVGGALPQALERPETALCSVCVRRGASHGPERAVAWREFDSESYAFCSAECASAFDAMPEGYAKPKLPRAAPALALESIEDMPIELTTPDSRATLVDFWATWCAPCVRSMPELSQLYRQHADEGLRVVGISIDEDRKALERFLSRQAPAYPVAHDDGDMAAWMEWKVPAIPALFLLDAEGQIVAQWSGEVPLAEVRAEIALLLAAD